MPNRLTGAPTLWDDLAADIATAVALQWGVRDQARRDWVAKTEGFSPPQISDEYPEEGLVVCFAGSITVVDPADDTVAAAVIAVADVLQTGVMDELGRGWPEHHDAQGFIGLLTPGRGPDGAPSWCLHGSPITLIGRLAETMHPTAKRPTTE